MRLEITNSFSTLFKRKVNTLLKKLEDPKEALDYSSTRQVTQEYHLSSHSQKTTGDAEDEALG